MPKKKTFSIYLILLSATPMLSTDLYLPALPEISEYYRTTNDMTNLTMIAFTVSLAITALFWGPISDKYGRRPIVLCGSALYFIGSLLCIFAPSIQFLIVFRVIQAFGGGATMVAAPAFVRDVYEKEQQEKMLSLVQGLALLWPAVAPSLGALIMGFTDWRGIFILMAALGGILFVGTLPVKETLRNPLTVNVFMTFTRLWVVLRNKRFTLLVTIFMLPGIPIMSFITASPYILQLQFGLSEQAYGLFYATSAIGMMVGTLSYYKFSRKFGRTTTAYLGFFSLVFGGIGILLIGEISAWIFVALVIPAAVFCAMGRPLCSFLALNMQENDTGSASSLLNAMSPIYTSIGIAILAFFNDYLSGVGILYLLFGVIGTALFAIFLKRV